MNLAQEYKKRLVTAEEAVKVVKSGDWVEYGQFATQPMLLDKALAARKNELRDVKIRTTTRVTGMPEVVKADPSAEHFRYHSFHFMGVDRRAQEMGNCWYIPILYHEVPSWYRNYMDLDVAMLGTTPMDEHGYFNFGPSCSFSKAITERTKILILEVNPNIPRCLGGREECVHISEVDHIVEADWPFPEFPFPDPTDLDRKIAALIVNEIEDGACLQIGQGGMPIAVGWLLVESGLKDLGIHTEMFCDCMMGMIDSGKITGAKKTLDKYKIVYTFSLGVKSTYDFLHNNPTCAIYPVSYTNDPAIVSQNDKVISINNCIEVDLFGQVSSESSGPKQLAGTGGQLDFALGAYHSRGGKSFICFGSAYSKDGTPASRIVPTLKPGTIVTTPRSVVSYLVSEYGIVLMKGKSTWQRAEAIISIAHPDFREGLIKEAEKMGLWTRSSKKD
jgi:butyryl-CoA:acetate CoA-transferase